MIRFEDFADEVEPPEEDDAEEAELSAESPRWNSSPVLQRRGAAEEIRQYLPQFGRDENPFFCHPQKDLIVRIGNSEEPASIPVGLVSRSYRLIQHEEVLEGMVDCLTRMGIDVQGLEFDLTLAGVGERMMLRAQLGGEFEFSPDGHQTTLELITTNSVDGSGAIRTRLGWYRFICANGMFVGVGLGASKVAHSSTARLERAFEPVRHQLAVARKERKILEKWGGETVRKGQLVDLADGPVLRVWGPLAASRLLHICRTGYDARFADPFEQARPSERSMLKTVPVPGSPAPADNRYSVSQALSWIASRRNDLHEAVGRQRQIGRLMRQLC